ncbi:MAG TPA: hypothetical protein PK335_01830 [Draconibacterium sp.]|nr:hypothetical protein [Draconibacterium sp.]
MNLAKNKYLVFIFFCLLIIVHHFAGYLGHFGYDDMLYAKLAHNLNLGQFNPQDHFSFRITLLGLTSLSYRLLGINDFASSLPSMLAFTATLFLVFIVLKKEKPVIIVIGLSFFSLNLWGLFYSDKLMPDALVTFFAFLSIFFIYVYKFRKRTFPVLVYAFAGALALFLGFNTKGNIVLVFPLLAYLFIVDLILKRDLRFWLLFIGSSVLLLLIYFTFYHFVLGNAFARFQAIIQNSYLNQCSYSEQPFVITLKRIAYQLLLLFISHALITGFLFIFASPKHLFSKNTFLFRTNTGFFVLSAVVLLLSSNFMTISVTGYSPMCLDPRHFLFIVPIAGIAATLLIKDNIQNLNFIVRSIVLGIIVMVVAYVSKSNTSWLLYLPLIVALIVSSLFRKTRFNYVIFSVLIFIALSINLVQMAIYAYKVDFKKQEKIFKETVLTLDHPALVLTNTVQRNLAHYLNKFNKTGIEVLSYNDFDQHEHTDNIPIYLFKNYYTRYLSGLNDQQLPYYARVTEGYEKLYQDKTLDIQFFKIDSLTTIRTILEEKNDFEGNNNKWSNYQSSHKIVYSGSYSSLLGKYSSTLKVKLDTLDIKNAKQLIVTANFQILLMEESEVRFVFSTDSSGLWKGINFDKQIKAYGNWAPVSVSEIINIEDLSPDDTFVLYILNNKEQEVYLDDFDIRISVMKKQLED